MEISGKRKNLRRKLWCVWWSGGLGFCTQYRRRGKKGAFGSTGKKDFLFFYIFETHSPFN